MRFQNSIAPTANSPTYDLAHTSLNIPNFDHALKVVFVGELSGAIVASGGIWMMNNIDKCFAVVPFVGGLVMLLTAKAYKSECDIIRTREDLYIKRMYPAVKQAEEKEQAQSELSKQKVPPSFVRYVFEYHNRMKFLPTVDTACDEFFIDDKKFNRETVNRWFNEIAKTNAIVGRGDGRTGNLNIGYTADIVIAKLST